MYKIVKQTDDYLLVWKPANIPTTPIKSNPSCLIADLVKDFPYLKYI